MQEREAIKNKIEAYFKGINDQFESSTINIENSIEQITEFKSSNLGLDDSSKLQQQIQPQPNTQYITDQFSKLSDDLIEAVKFKQ